MTAAASSPDIVRIEVSAYEVPLPGGPESDATLEWDSTTVIVVEAHAGGERGLGYTYANAAVARCIEDDLAPLVEGRDALEVERSWRSMQRGVRNLSTSGSSQYAIAAVDVALWDLKARLLDVPVSVLIGRHHERVPLYGSGGFTSYSIETLQDEMAAFIERGIPRVKMKIGRDPEADPERVLAVRKAIGDDPELYVDANGCFETTAALRVAHELAGFGVTWFEEPVSSDDLAGLRTIRERAPVGMDITAGEYGTTIEYFRDMLGAGSVDVIQADVTRCGGFTGFLAVAGLARAFHTPLSAHTAPQLDAHVCGAAETLRHAEYFIDHVRIERNFFDGAIEPHEGALQPDLSRPGLGLEFKRADAERYAVYGSGR